MPERWSWTMLVLVACMPEAPTAPRASVARLSTSAFPRFLEVDAEIEGPNAEELFGWAVATGDANGDGYDDLAIGSRYGEAVHLHLGSPDGTTTAAAWVSTSPLAPSEYGSTVAMGDLNGDGYDDVLVGAPTFGAVGTHHGAVFAYFGSATGPSAVADWHIEGAVLSESLGGQVAIGDVNADGYGDAVVGSPGWNVSGGRVQVFLGSTTGPPGVADWEVEGTEPLESMGHRVLAADVDGDGIDDVVAASPYGSGSRVMSGVIRVWNGSAAGPSTTVSSSASGVQSFQSFGTGLSGVGDIDGDGVGDLLIGDGNDGTWLVRGTAAGLEVPPWWSRPGSPGSTLGNAAAGADFDRDGYADLMIAASGESHGSLSEGVVELYFGSAAGLDETPSWSAESDENSANLGQAMAIGDLDGDGAVDLVSAAPYHDATALHDAGGVWVFDGGCLDRTADADADGVGDGCDLCPGFDDLADGDGDVVPDACDLCPALAGDEQIDSDGDGTGDACDVCPLVAGNELDGDLDGFLDCADCGPTDPDVFPGAPERCNGIADACGELPADEADGDGDGSPDCGDCAPTDPDVFPGAPERCNGIADACGELPADEADGDGDGLTACAGDCDDGDPAVPGAEACNGIDDDCDGTVDEDCGDDPSSKPSGCGCAAGDARAAGVAALVALGLVLRRRRRR